eukprot:scaffold319505_cov27-Tisochrysis_lutea.AAC.1
MKATIIKEEALPDLRQYFRGEVFPMCTIRGTWPPHSPSARPQALANLWRGWTRLAGPVSAAACSLAVPPPWRPHPPRGWNLRRGMRHGYCACVKNGVGAKIQRAQRCIPRKSSGKLGRPFDAN